MTPLVYVWRAAVGGNECKFGWQTDVSGFFFSIDTLYRDHQITQFWGNRRLQMCGCFEGFPLNSALLFGLVI